MYELDIFANERGHQIIHLLPYHCQYNSIELVWAQVQCAVVCRNNTVKIADERLVNEELDNVMQEQWASCVKHAEHLEEDDFLKERQGPNSTTSYSKFERQ